MTRVLWLVVVLGLFGQVYSEEGSLRYFVPCLDTGVSEQFDVEILSDDPCVLVIHHFLNEEECDYLIKRARPFLRRSTVLAENVKDEIDPTRTSEGMFFPKRDRDPVVREIEERIVLVTGSPRSHGEGMQILRYDILGEYRPHYDFFDLNQPVGMAAYQRGGQRVATMIIYLSSVEKGGETIFPILQLAVKPERGSALLFFNCTPGGKADPRSFHGGAPVFEGEKWVAVKWIREGDFQ